MTLAGRLLARVQQELRAAGGRPRRLTRSGRDTLTASEQRVARLAAGGATNPEIVQELFVSLKTIETQVVNGLLSPLFAYVESAAPRT